MYFTRRNLPLPKRRFPFHSPAWLSPYHVPDCHLVRTVIPCLPNYDSLGIFYSRVCHSLSLFCKHGFQKQYRQLCGHHNQPPGPLSPHVHSRQATLHAAHDSVHHIAGSYRIRTRKRLPKKEFTVSSHKFPVSTETGSYAPCHWSAPGILNPQHPP